jgi:hypothetical protein
MFDQNLMFSDQQALAQVAGSYLSLLSIDTWKGKTVGAGTPNLGGPLTADFGRANDMLDIVAIVTQAFTSAGAATLQFQIVQADAQDLTGNLEVLRETRAQAAGTQPSVFTAGRICNIGKVPSMTRRFLGLQYVIAVARDGRQDHGETSEGVFSNDSALLL